MLAPLADSSVSAASVLSRSMDCKKSSEKFGCNGISAVCPSAVISRESPSLILTHNRSTEGDLVVKKKVKSSWSAALSPVISARPAGMVMV